MHLHKLRAQKSNSSKVYFILIDDIYLSDNLLITFNFILILIIFISGLRFNISICYQVYWFIVRYIFYS